HHPQDGPARADYRHASRDGRDQGVEAATRAGRRQTVVARGGDHQLDDAERAPKPPVDQRATPQAHREGFRDDRRRSESPAEAVHSDEEDAQGDGWNGRTRERQASKSLGAQRAHEIAASFQPPASSWFFAGSCWWLVAGGW